MLKTNGRNVVSKDEIIFKEGDALTQIGIVLSGKVVMQGENIRLVKSNGSYLALNSLESQVYSATYTVLEDAVIYALPVQGEASIRNIIAKNADYRAIMVSSQFKTAVELYRIKSSYLERAERLCSFLQRSYEEYKGICAAYNVPATGIEELEQLQPYEDTLGVNEHKIKYYEEAAKIPLSANKEYFSYSEKMAFFQVSEIMELVTSLLEDCAELVEYINTLLGVMCLRPRNNLFDHICDKAHIIKEKNDIPEEIHMLLSGIVDEFVFQHKELESQTVNAPIYNMDLMKRKMEGLVSEKAVVDERSQEEREADLKRDMESLKGSIDQILKFASSFNDEDGFKLKRNVDFLVKAPDRMSVDDDVKKAKKTITPLVFKLYLCCYRKIKEGLIHPPKAVELFMNFGMLDERLLDEEHLRFLCSVEPEENKGPCKVVTMMEWLDMIHDGKRDPSKSEFDEDYVENLRSLKKQGEITEKEQKVLLNDMNRRVEYEIMNMQMSNSRTIYGQPSSYMPILYKDAIFGYLDKILVTKKKINESVERLVKLDYSVFYREVIYSNTACKITNETVLKNVYPDVILFPLFGTNASMWQEVGSKNKGTPGRCAFHHKMKNQRRQGALPALHTVSGRLAQSPCVPVRGRTPPPSAHSLCAPVSYIPAEYSSQSQDCAPSGFSSESARPRLLPAAPHSGEKSLSTRGLPPCALLCPHVQNISECHTGSVSFHQRESALSPSAFHTRCTASPPAASAGYSPRKTPFSEALFPQKTAFRTHSQAPRGTGCSSMPRPRKEAAA